MYIFDNFMGIYGLLMTICASLFMYSVTIARHSSRNDTLKNRIKIIMFLQDAGITMFYICAIYSLINFLVKVSM